MSSYRDYFFGQGHDVSVALTRSLQGSIGDVSDLSFIIFITFK